MGIRWGDENNGATDFDHDCKISMSKTGREMR